VVHQTIQVVHQTIQVVLHHPKRLSENTGKLVTKKCYTLLQRSLRYSHECMTVF